MVRGVRGAAICDRLGSYEHARHRVRHDGEARRPRRPHHVPQPARADARGELLELTLLAHRPAEPPCWENHEVKSRVIISRSPSRDSLMLTMRAPSLG